MKILSVENLHLAAKLYFKVRGFRWEERRTGELGVGYWKIKLKTRDKKQTYPSRLVLIPGFGDSPLSWHAVSVILRPWIRSHYDELVIMDFPGFRGFLSSQRSFPSMDELLTATHDALDALKPKAILGHSLGGWLAGHYAMECGTGKRPKAHSLNYKGPETLVLVNSAGVFPDEETRKVWADLFNLASERGFEVMRPHLFAKEPFWFKWVAGNMGPFINREDVVAFIKSCREDHSIEERAGEIRCKVRLVWGEQDSMIPVSCAGAWLQHLRDSGNPDCRAFILPKSGHSPHLEQPLVLATVLGQILSLRTLSSPKPRWWKELALR